MGSYKPSSFPNRDELPSGCFHSGNTCKACIGAYIASDIEGKFFDNVGCPNCMASWDRYYIELYSTKEVMMRYETIGMLRVVQAMPNFRWCLSPKCNSGQIHQAGNKKPIVKCVACGFKICFTHQIAWHSGLTCKQYGTPAELNNDARGRTSREEKESAARLERYTKPCPHCAVRIWKAGGCRRMACKFAIHPFFQTTV